ncbi:MAG: YdeI/OmpD-associated family protein [Bacilli bacterium]|nr:YdeI/OmpD-associated family protein [Bacilli bacterium]
MKILSGIVHELPEDMLKALEGDEDIPAIWNSLTPIQRNEWICWVTIVKKQETRENHILRMIEELKQGVRQPCCWPGCPHRKPSRKQYFKSLNT